MNLKQNRRSGHSVVRASVYIAVMLTCAALSTPFVGDAAMAAVEPISPSAASLHSSPSPAPTETVTPAAGSSTTATPLVTASATNPSESVEPSVTNTPAGQPMKPSSASSRPEASAASSPKPVNSATANAEPTVYYRDRAANDESYQVPCDGRYIYALGDKGQLEAVNTTTGNVRPIGDPASDNVYRDWFYAYSVAFNALGVGRDGNTIYAVGRDTEFGQTNRVEVYKFDTSAGHWRYTGKYIANSGVALVAGAVNPINGRYYFGGFTRDEKFRLWEYNPLANALIERGTVNLPAMDPYEESYPNGDIEFDPNGGLMMLEAYQGEVFTHSILFEDLTIGTSFNHTIPFTSTVRFTPSNMPNANGMAVGVDGDMFVGDHYNIYKYKQPSYTNETALIDEYELGGELNG